MYLSDMSLCYCEYRTSRPMSEPPGGAPVWALMSSGSCRFLCDHLSFHQLGRSEGNHLMDGNLPLLTKLNKRKIAVVTER